MLDVRWARDEGEWSWGDLIQAGRFRFILAESLSDVYEDSGKYCGGDDGNNGSAGTEDDGDTAADATLAGHIYPPFCGIFKLSVFIRIHRLATLLN
ncbi:hypothetical protein AK812_SmicGene33395 [Symbiodinium microadriaticum]|uniref:Uncharacterized protein n=1 Tax=Symbiodinium microadriaticum TaxID=2951 RepID=A0A1Q9CRN7_SYMMI|nr:hypothetical protein AK812_SmicGene33395 [Symbiodinium microadriaticum]